MSLLLRVPSNGDMSANLFKSEDDEEEQESVDDVVHESKQHSASNRPEKNEAAAISGN